MRVFYGRTHGEIANLPENALFRPQNVEEAKIRIPTPRLQVVEDLSSGSLDLLVPAHLGLGGLFIPRQMRWRMFYDYGRAYENDFVYRAAGFGLYTPLGGDVVGKGGVSFFKLSLLYVPFVKVSGGKSGKSGILFDFFGQL